MRLLERESPITTDYIKQDKFVVFENKVGIGSNTQYHNEIALRLNLYTSVLGPDGELIVHDGGYIFDDGEELVILNNFTTTTILDEINKAKQKGELTNEEEEEMKREIRRRTGALIAEKTGRTVKIVHGDWTEETFP